MPDQNPHPFALDAHPAKADPALIEADARHFARIDANLTRQVADLETRLDALRRAPAGRGQAALDRDLETHRLTARLRLLRRFGLDLCLGRIAGGDGTLYIGRLGLTDDDGEPLLIGWRAPAAEPFFGATHGNPMGLTSRRRYRWSDRRITDYWDEVFTDAGPTNGAALDDQSAFIASLGTSRSSRMRDVLGTIQADQDAIIRADGRGALVVDGGPGTGKTVVALHRAAYLLYADPRLQAGRGSVLFVGPSYSYMAYVDDVLPSLGEEGVRTCTLADLVPEGHNTAPESDRQVARLKSDGRMAAAVEEAVRRREQPPRRTTTIDTAWGEVTITPSDWREAFGAADPSTSSGHGGQTHNEAREEVWQALLDILVDQICPRPELIEGSAEDGWDDLDDWDDSSSWDSDYGASTSYTELDEENQFDAYGVSGREDTTEVASHQLAENADLREVFDDVWPLLDPVALVRSLWNSPALLLRCAPWLSVEEVETLQRSPQSAWTRDDLPLLDAARLRVGDPEAALRRRRAAAEEAAERAAMDDVVADLITTDDSEMQVMSMLRGQDLRSTLAGASAPEIPDSTSLDGPFAHIIVDEAQELTDAEWQMLLRRNPSRSFTIVGDRAQARHGFTQSWDERLTALGLREVSVASLTVNYRTPSEVMDEAAPVIRAVLPVASVPTSIRSSGIPVRYGRVSERGAILKAWLAENSEGIACVIGDPSFEATERIHSLDSASAKGLEFDLVVLMDSGPGTAHEDRGIEAAVDRYVAMTRTTRELVILSDG